MLLCWLLAGVATSATSELEVEGPTGRGQAALELDVRGPSPMVWWLLGAMSVVAAATLGWRRTRSRHRQ